MGFDSGQSDLQKELSIRITFIGIAPDKVNLYAVTLVYQGQTLLAMDHAFRGLKPARDAAKALKRDYPHFEIIEDSAI